MRVLLAVDGSKFTKKALAFLVTHEALMGADAELIVLNVQMAVSPRVKTMLGAATVHAYHRDEAQKVLEPIERFLKRHGIPFRASWVAGIPATQIVQAAKREKAHMVVMGTHGHGLLGRALLGSVAQRVVADVDVPVLLVQ
ncbi:universal stress protein [Polaromonas sp. JS666]|uniref:universal stress protein n=1 Tax=Polaromonas sp. (strain JS666 / ATCC BAA-500) TaxID=296591 RepID=UPI00088E697C|nr:universal stress protein [Polaromonas sp. JS666]SDM44707.1 Nucleotide-binding universal stress protein, UspA family [Polaromonas sp. JS666]